MRTYKGFREGEEVFVRGYQKPSYRDLKGEVVVIATIYSENIPEDPDRTDWVKVWPLNTEQFDAKVWLYKPVFEKK